MAEITHWEYHIEELGSVLRGPKLVDVEAYLNQVGEAGWEVVNVHHLQSSNKVWVTMKRPLTDETRRRRSRAAESWPSDQF